MHFTDKSLDNLSKLNFYELQHALYASWQAYDHTEGGTRLASRARIPAIYGGYRRRGITSFQTSNIP